MGINMQNDTIIPIKVVRDRDLPASCKLLFGNILSICDSTLSCYATNQYLSDISKINKSTISRHVSKLIKAGYIETENIDVFLDKEKMMEIISIYGRKCEWCGIRTISLHKHHFPIPKKHRGLETVSICPNCHSDFHLLKNSRLIRIKEEKNEQGL